MKPAKISPRQREAFEYFAQCQDTKRLPAIPEVPDGVSALEAFSSYETHGILPPCREPVLLTRALNGKAWSGLTVTMVAEDLLDCIAHHTDLAAYPPRMVKDIRGRAQQLALKKIGFIPTFLQ